MEMMGMEIALHIGRESTGLLMVFNASRALNELKAQQTDKVNTASVRVMALYARVITSSIRVIMPPLSVKNPVKKPAVSVKELKDWMKNPTIGAVFWLSKASQYAANRLKRSEQIAALSSAGCFGEKILSLVKVSPKILSPPDPLGLNYIELYCPAFVDVRHSMMW